jgi:uncharacterized repeat protein (TIGR01451 family)
MKKHYTKIILILLAMVAIFGCQVALADAAAIWTTDASNEPVNFNVGYPDKQSVYLNGGPVGGGPGLDDGWYYVMITAPDGTLLGYNDATVAEVVYGVMSPINLWDNLYKASNGYQGYDDTNNSGGEYKVWASMDPSFSGGTDKTDNFKVNYQPCTRIVTVTVLGPEETPIAGEPVTLTGTNDYNVTVSTDTNGVATFDVPDEKIEVTYTANVTKSGYTPNPATASDYFADEECRTMELTINLTPDVTTCTRTVTVTVLGPEETPIAGEPVTLTGTNDYNVTVSTDTNGVATFDVPDDQVAATYTATVTKSGYTPNPAIAVDSFTAEDCNVTLPLTINLTPEAVICTRAVTVTVLGLEGAVIPAEPVTLTGSNGYSATVNTDVNGVAIFDVPDDQVAVTYTATVTKSGYTPNPATTQGSFTATDCNVTLPLTINLTPVTATCTRLVVVNAFEMVNDVQVALNDVNISLDPEFTTPVNTGSVSNTYTFDVIDQFASATYTANVSKTGYNSNTGTATFGMDVCGTEIINVILTKSGGGPGPSIERSILVVKDADKTTVLYGGTITYTYTITNTGDVTLENVTLTDDILGDIIDASDNITLAPKESITRTVTYTTKIGDVGTLTNVATVTGDPTDDSGTVRDTDNATVTVTRPSGGSPSSGEATGEGVTPEVITLPTPQVPQAPPAVPAPTPQPIVVPVEVPMAPAELPFTGGDPMAFAYAGFVLTALGTALRRKFK